MERLMYDLKDLILCDIDTVVKKGEISPSDYEALGEAVDIIKDIETIMAMKEYGAQPEEIRNTPGMSGNYRPMSRVHWDDYSAPRMTDTSYNRMNRASRDDEIMSKLNRMMGTAQTEQERATIQRMMDELGR